MADSDKSVELYQANGARVTRRPDGRLLIYSSRRLAYALLFLAMACGLAPFVVGFLVLLAGEVDKGEELNPFALLCLSPFLLLVFAFVVLSLMATLVFAFPRRCTIDVARGVATFDHVPGFSRSVALSEIRTVDIVMVSDKSGHGCFLGASVCGTRRMMWIHTIASRWSSVAELLDRMRPLAELVAENLRVPVECSRGRMSWLTTVKGTPFEHEARRE